MCGLWSILTLVFIYLDAPVIAAYEFDSQTSPMASASEWEEWQSVVETMDKENREILSCLNNDASCTRRMKPIKVLLTRSQGMEVSRQLRLINVYVNRYHRKYRRDRRTTQEGVLGKISVKQEWTSLLEFMRRGGDCEDYATSKYQLLRLMGFESNDLRVVVVKENREREYHAVVAVRIPDRSVVLLDTDNRILKRRPSRYRYIYAINEDSIWEHNLESVSLPRSMRQQMKRNQ